MNLKTLSNKVGFDDFMALRQVNQTSQCIDFEFFSDLGLTVVDRLFIQIHDLGAVADGLALREQSKQL